MNWVSQLKLWKQKKKLWKNNSENRTAEQDFLLRWFYVHIDEQVINCHNVGINVKFVFRIKKEHENENSRRIQQQNQTCSGF